MVNKPKRRKYKDNPYMIERINGINLVSFKDGNNDLQVVEVDADIYDVFDEFELKDISQMHKDEKHLDFRVLDNTDKTDIFLYQNISSKIKSVDDYVCENICNDELKDAISTLTEPQKRRIKKYYFEDKTLQIIANEEGCSPRAVKYSIDIGIENLKKILKK